MKLVSDVGIKAICSGCPNLTRLGISRVDALTDQCLRTLGSHCRNLRDVEAAGCSHFTDAGFTALANVSIEGMCMNMYIIYCNHVC